MSGRESWTAKLLGSLEFQGMFLNQMSKRKSIAVYHLHKFENTYTDMHSRSFQRVLLLAAVISRDHCAKHLRQQ